MTQSTVQSLPCNIAYDGNADVGARLIVRGEGMFPRRRTRRIGPGGDSCATRRATHAGDSLETAFRGRRLLGSDAPLPSSVTGVVLETDDGRATVHSTFDRVRVWGHDERPNGDHYVLDSLDVIQALTALHSD